MSASSSKPQQQPPPHLDLHVDNTTSATATTATNCSAASPGSASSSHHSAPRNPRPTPSAAGGVGSGGIGTGQNPACAACKYQRRRCNPDCPLAPYFPADQQRRFLNAHRLFGVSNIQKTLRRINPKYGPDAMRTLIYQSEARAADPVGGCVSIIEALQRQIRDTEMELQFVRQQVAICRQAAATDALTADPAAMIPVGAGQDDMVDVDAIYAGQQPSIVPAGGGSGLVFRSQQQDYHHNVLKVEEHNDPSSSHQQQLYDYFCYNGAASDDAASDDGGMQQYGFADVVDSSVKAGLPFVDAFNVQPQVLPSAIQHNGPAADADVFHSEQKVATPVMVVKQHDNDVDEHMEEQQATTGAPCHLELGFSSSF